MTAFAPGLVGLALIAHLGRALLAAGRARWAACATAGGWLLAAALSVVLVPLFADGDRDPHATLLALGLASSVGMTAAGVALLVGARRVRIGGGTADGALRAVGRTLVAALTGGVAAAVLGRVVTDAILDSGPTQNGLAGPLLAGVVGGLVVVLVLAAGWGVGERANLRALVRRGPVGESQVPL